MKSVNGLVLNSLLAIVLGVILIVWPDQAMHYLMIAIGLFFLLPGLFSLFHFFMRGKAQRVFSAFPIEACGSIVLGALLLLFPAFFISIVMYLLGVLAVLGGVLLIVRLISARKNASVSFWYYIIPIIILLTGVLILTNPYKIAENMFVIFGTVCILFGFSLLLNWYKLRKRSL